MALKLEICPDDDMVDVLDENINNARFVWNKLLEEYNKLKQLFNSHNCPLNPTISNLNAILNMLKVDYPFLYECESTSQQQVVRDLNQAFNKFFKEHRGYPRFKSKMNNKKSFRIQKNGNNVRVTNKRIRLAKLGFVHYRTSKKIL